MIVTYNRQYNSRTPKVTIVTPVYNRRATIGRTLESVRNQSYTDIEYVIVDDGSTEPIDDVVIAYMEKVNYPVAFIKKENGGVHTARNCGVKLSRGEYLFFLDSDDEIVPHAIETYVSEWERIPDDSKKEYREILALCKDENGRQMGESWPPHVNEMPYKEAIKAVRGNHAAHVSMMRADIMREHPWPEPEQVKFVAESLIWDMLEPYYRKRFVNDSLYIYHTETEGSVSKSVHKRNIQYCINDLFRYLYYVNNYQIFQLTIAERVKKMLFYCTYCHVLIHYNSFPSSDWAREGVEKSISNLFMKYVLWIPSFFASRLFMKRYM